MLKGVFSFFFLIGLGSSNLKADSSKSKSFSKNCTYWSIPRTIQLFDKPGDLKYNSLEISPPMNLCITDNIVKKKKIQWIEVYLYRKLGENETSPKWVNILDLRKDPGPKIPIKNNVQKDEKNKFISSLRVNHRIRSKPLPSKLNFKACNYLETHSLDLFNETKNILCKNGASSCESLRSQEECEKNMNCIARFGSGSGPNCNPCTPDYVFWGCQVKPNDQLESMIEMHSECVRTGGVFESSSKTQWCRCLKSAENFEREYVPRKGCQKARSGFSSQDGGFYCSADEIFNNEKGCVAKKIICKEKGGEWIEVHSNVQITEYLELNLCRGKKSARWEKSPNPPLGKCKDKNYIVRWIEGKSPFWFCDQAQQQALKANDELISFTSIQKDSIVLCTYQPEFQNDPLRNYPYSTPYKTNQPMKSFCRVNGLPLGIYDEE